MADDSTIIIEGCVKLREGRKWKSRWCVMRRLSPVADAVRLEVWESRRDVGRARRVELAALAAVEAGALAGQAHALALLGRGGGALLAPGGRARQAQWLARLGAGRQFLVLVARAPRRLRGPARLHVRPGAVALVAGAPPRLLAVWDLTHLRRYGVVEGRFCFEAGSQCGKNEGLHVLVTEDAAEIARAFHEAAAACNTARRYSMARRSEAGADSPEAYGADVRLAELDAERPVPPGSLRLAPAGGGREGGAGPPWGGATLQRCSSCMAQLGALSRSSTATLTPGARFSPAWTMDALCDAATTPGAAPPPRPPKPAPLVQIARIPQSCSCVAGLSSDTIPRPGVGPYENYDVPRAHSIEVDDEYYDTPRRLRERLDEEPFRIARSTDPDAVVLSKPCGCLLRVGKRRPEPTVVETDESFQPTDCPCRKVTDWANSWIKLPYCRREPEPSSTGPPAADETTRDVSALYARVDVARKWRRRSWAAPEPDRGPLAHYENLSFALSLEHYENARDLLRRAGVTRAELDAIGATLRTPALTTSSPCERCGHPPRTTADEYLLMEPKSRDGAAAPVPPAGYAPMSPIGTLTSHAPVPRSLGEKSASNPALCATESMISRDARRTPAEARVERYKRSSSADSSRFLEDVEEFEGGAGARGSGSSLETLRAARCACAERPAAPTPAAANRDSSSSNDSGVSGCSLRPEPAPARWPRRRARSSGPAADKADEALPAKSASAEAEVPVLLARPMIGSAVVDAHSTSSGASDLSDYVETLSLCSSHSSGDAPHTVRSRLATSTLRPRSGREYSAARPPRLLAHH